MRARGLILCLVAAALAAGTRLRADAPQLVAPLPPLSEEGLPALVAQSPRNANYTIEARLDAERHTIEGTLVLDWRNTTGQPQAAFPFHLYWNAFRNTRSTSARGEGRRAARVAAGPLGSRGFGYIQVTSVRLLDAGEGTDLLPTLRYLQPDDANADDRTVMEIRTPAPVPPEGSARFQIAWSAQVPYGDVGRSGWVHDYHFIAQWFPKIGVFWKGAWNAHQFHPWTEFFSDYGVYDVQLTVPQGYLVGATGRAEEPRDNPDGTRTFRFREADVHDFTWVASRRIREHRGRFDDPGYPPVDIRLLVQPEHDHLAERYIEATRIALRSYGTWSAPYPYGHITVVDPAWGSASGGMEYPTLFTGGAYVQAPPELHSPESVTIHECGHQFWYQLVGTNEFEEAWLDEGFNSYHDERAAHLFLSPKGWGRRYFGPLRPRRGAREGWPVVAPGVIIGRGESDLEDLRKSGQTDVMARRGWDYRTNDSYTLNSYGKPALSLQTLEGLVGDERMTRILRTYARRYRFAHPTSEDFIAVVNEVTGQDWRWYFDQTWFSSELVDYAVTAKSARAQPVLGYTEGPDGRPVLASPAPPAADGPYESEVVIQRLGGARLPVELRVEFSDGRIVEETWDGQYRWTRFRYPGPARVVSATLDPLGKIALDVDPSNNSWMADAAPVARRAASKWTLRWMFWLQNLLELHTLLV